ncbi:MAG: DUF58 domain-containing protein [Pseudorhodoplanes sp.]
MAKASAGKDELKATQRASGAARLLAANMPRLVMEARRIAASVIHGLHGRRRAGPGENFWQYRHYTFGEEVRRIDWRRSARDDHLYVREREWEAAHTMWIWPDRSPSMLFSSSAERETKLERAVVIAMAIAEVLVDAGERVGVPGLMRPTGNRTVIQRMADAFIHDPDERPSLPRGFVPAALSEVVLISDFWSPIADIRATFAQVAGANTQIHAVQIVDPAEETFPYSGRIEFSEPEGAGEITVGRAENWRTAYEERLARHRAEIRDEMDRIGGSFITHRTDRPASDLLLALQARLSAGDLMRTAQKAGAEVRA